MRDTVTVARHKVQKRPKPPAARVGRFWEAEAAAAAVGASEWILLQRLRTRYYYRWRIWQAVNAVFRDYEGYVSATEELKSENESLRAALQDHETASAARRRLDKDFEALQAANGDLKRDLSAAVRDRERDLAGLKAAQQQQQEAKAHNDALLRQMQEQLDRQERQNAAAQKEIDRLERALMGREGAERDREMQDRMALERQQHELQLARQQLESGERERKEKDRQERDRIERERERDRMEREQRDREREKERKERERERAREHQEWERERERERQEWEQELQRERQERMEERRREKDRREKELADRLEKQRQDRDRELQQREKERQRATPPPAATTTATTAPGPTRKASPPRKIASRRSSVVEPLKPPAKPVPKNYPELGLCLSDTLPRPILKGKSKAKLGSLGRQKRLEGIKVVGVRGPAKDAGILPEDTVRKLNGIDTQALAEFKVILKQLPPQDPLELTIERDGDIYIYEVIPVPSTEEPGHAFQRLVRLNLDEKVEVDLTRLAAPKGQYYDDTGRLHSLLDEKDDSQGARSPPLSPQGSPTRKRSLSPTSQGGYTFPAADSADSFNSPFSKKATSPEPTPRSPPKKTPMRPRPSEYDFADPGERKLGGSPARSFASEGTPRLPIRVGARVRRNADFWQYGNQDGGEGALGTVAKVDKMLGWVTVRWDATGRGSTYRWGKDSAWDVEVVEGGGADSGGEAMVASIPPPPRQRPVPHGRQDVVPRLEGSESPALEYHSDGGQPGHAPTHL